MTTKLSYRIVLGNGLPRGGADDDYVGLEVFIDGEIKTTFTGFLPEELLRELLSGGGTEL